MTFPAVRRPLLRRGRPDPGEAGSDQPSFQRDQIQPGRTERSSWTDCARAAPDRIRISVKDTGAGLPPEMLAQLFQPFNRLGPGSERRGRHRHRPGREQAAGGADGRRDRRGEHGRVRERVLVRTELGGRAATCSRTRRSRRRSHQRRSQRGAPLRTLLYVEDNPANLKLVEQLIARRPDMRLLSASDGNLGIELARAYQPDVILMDINLPGISGIEALKILREDPERRTFRWSPSAPTSARSRMQSRSPGFCSSFQSVAPARVGASCGSASQRRSRRTSTASH